jgi:hypothetical protein
MVVTSQCKIALYPGSVFCFGTISSVANEKGILHRIADPPEKKPSSEISEKVRMRQQRAQPLVPEMKTTSCKSRAESSLTRRTPLPTSPTKEWTWITRKKEQAGWRTIKLSFQHLRPQRRMEMNLSPQQLLSTPTSSSSGGEWSHLPSATTSQPCQGKKLPSEKLGDGGTDVEIFGDITRLGRGTQHSPYPRMKSRKKEKLLTNESLEKGGTLADVITGKLKTEIENKLSRMLGYAERTLSSCET